MKETVKSDTDNKYTKESILMSKRYSNRKDLLNALLDDKEYSFKEVDAIIEKFMKGKVV